MKVTSASIEAYLYKEVVARLKDVDIGDRNGFDNETNPLVHLLGETMAIDIIINESDNEILRHNYQRRRREQEADLSIMLYRSRGHNLRLGRYSRQFKHLRLYEQAFKEARMIPIMHKLKDVFERSTTKQRVTIVKGENDDKSTA